MRRQTVRSALHRVFLCLAVGASALLRPGQGSAAETIDPVTMGKTLVIVKVDSDQPLDIHTTFQESPPTITIGFPTQRVIGSLPERSVVAKGIIQAITTRYDRTIRPGVPPERFIRSLQIVLSAPYAYRVRSAPGHVVVEIDHPTSIRSASVEVGLKGGTIIGGFRTSTMSERFRAMQEAMSRATPTPWTMRITEPSSPAGLSRPASETASAGAIPSGQPSRIAAASGPAPPPVAPAGCRDLREGRQLEAARRDRAGGAAEDEQVMRLGAPPMKGERHDYRG